MADEADFMMGGPEDDVAMHGAAVEDAALDDGGAEYDDGMDEQLDHW